MKLGIFCIVVGIIGTIINIIGVFNCGWGYLRGIIFMPSVMLFGIYLIKRHKHLQYLQSMKKWAKENPEEASKWLNQNS